MSSYRCDTMLSLNNGGRTGPRHVLTQLTYRTVKQILKYFLQRSVHQYVKAYFEVSQLGSLVMSRTDWTSKDRVDEKYVLPVNPSKVNVIIISV